jgi:hypothetical protein
MGTSSRRRRAPSPGAGTGQRTRQQRGGHPPTSGHRGDLYADSTGRLWFCKTSGAQATWKQIG